MSGRLFVDCQVFQHNTWNRGMGRYTLKLLEAIDKNSTPLTLIFNNQIPLEAQRLKSIKLACPSADIIFLKLSDDPNKVGGWKKLLNICQSELDEQLAGLLSETDTYLVASNFSIRYCSAFPSLPCRKSIIFWDITPYLHWSDYKDTPDFKPAKYFSQLKTLFDADQLWSISESASNEAKLWLGIEATKVTNIRGASIRSLSEKDSRPKTIRSDAKFLICPSADGPHKNNENMVRAFAEFNRGAGSSYKLVITSDFSEQTKSMLGAISPDVIFTGHVTDGELGWLYKNCEALLFVSKTEGLGLPILEAVSANKKVICSDIEVFREISQDAFYYADPRIIESISSAIYSAMINEESWLSKKRSYNDINTIFSWPSVADTCQKLINNEIPVSTSNDAVKGTNIWYCDEDEDSYSRNVAEILYSRNKDARFYTLRLSGYNYSSPSYLMDMGVAQNALDADPDNGKNVYFVDDTLEGSKLLLIALHKPGTIIALFRQNTDPIHVSRYLKILFGDKITYKQYIEILINRGNTLSNITLNSRRGEQSFIGEVESINRNLS